MPVYKIAVGSSFRFVRAITALHARFIASQVWNAHHTTAQSLGQQAPDIGRAGYDRTAHSEAALFIAPHKAGKVQSKVNGFHKAEQDRRSRVFNPEFAALFVSTK